VGDGRYNPLSGAEGTGDFFAPFFTLKFLTVEQLEGNVNVDGEQVGNNERQPIEESKGQTSSGDITLEFDYSSWLRSFSPSIEIRLEGGGFAEATVTLEPPFADAVKIVDDRAIQRNGVMVIEWGWLPSTPTAKKLTSDKHIFMITKPGLDMSGTDIRVTIHGTDLLSGSGIARQAKTSYARNSGAAARAEENGTFATDLAVLEHLARKTNLELDVSQVGADSPLRQQRPLNKEEPEVLEQNSSDWLFFKELCDTNRCSFFVLGDKVIVGDMNTIKKVDASYNLLFMQAPENDRDIPMEAFSTRALETLFSTPAGRGMTHSYADPDTGEVTTLVLDPLDMADEEHTGQLNAAGARNADGTTYQVDQQGTAVTPNPAMTGNTVGTHKSNSNAIPNRDEHAKKPVRDGNTWMNTEATATVLGHPDLVPMMIVRVLCGSETFSGAYRIIEVTHRIGMDGYSTDLKLKRESSSGDKNTGTGKVPITGGQDPPTREGGGEAVDPEPQERVDS